MTKDTQAKPSADEYHNHYCFDCHSYWVCFGMGCLKLLEKPCPKHESTTKPSAGALRAVKSLQNTFHMRFSEPELIAELIDRETGVAELLEAAKCLIPHIWEDNFDQGFESTYECAVIALKQAIAKCEGRGSE